MDIHWTQLPYIKPFQIFGPPVQKVSGIVYDSREAKDSFAFFCINGEETDGHLYIEEALLNGASAIIGSKMDAIRPFTDRHPEITFLVVDDARKALAHFAVDYYGRSCDQLIKIGVTGTNGKTTVASYVRDLFNLAGVPCGMLGTNGIFSSSEKLSIKKSTPTTPMSSDIQSIFRDLVNRGDRAASMEVSSIALDQYRVAGFDFDVAIHTNISVEHMEYHKTFEHYKKSKLKLFKQAKSCVVNLDDEGMAEDILAIIDVPYLTYSRNENSCADLIWTNINHGAGGITFDLIIKGHGMHRIDVPIFGEYNVGNLVAAMGAAIMSSIPFDKILEALPQMQQVDGRFQVLQGPENRTIVLDYAHTPVALDAVLNAVRMLPHEKLITLVAGIGIRDFAKMPKMAKTAEGKTDVAVVTVDHPGNNDPWVVVDEVLKGFSVPYKQEVLTAPSRKEAVIKALEVSEPGDIVLLTSGSINGAQLVRGEFIPHSDEEIIHDYFNNKMLSV